jgi:hypothetical protein
MSVCVCVCVCVCMYVWCVTYGCTSYMYACMHADCWFQSGVESWHRRRAKRKCNIIITPQQRYQIAYKFYDYYYATSVLNIYIELFLQFRGIAEYH